MKTQTFNQLRELVYARSGITLGPAKVALVSARIGKRLRALNLPDPETYLAYLGRSENQEEIVHLIDAISTNVTSFYREADHFDFLDQALRRWVASGQRVFKIWCAAASTGEEPYTLAMTVSEALQGSGAQAKILATDISTRVLEKCHEGIYSSEKVEPVPPKLRAKYFERTSGPDGTPHYTVSDSLKSLVAFNRLNLSVTPFPMTGPFDAIFIRNVMIYFDNDIRSRLLREAHRLLKPTGYLMVGHSEGLTGLVSDFKLERSSIYSR